MEAAIAALPGVDGHSSIHREAYGLATESTCVTDLKDRYFRVILYGSTNLDFPTIIGPGFGWGLSLSPD